MRCVPYLIFYVGCTVTLPERGIKMSDSKYFTTTKKGEL